MTGARAEGVHGGGWDPLPLARTHTGGRQAASPSEAAAASLCQPPPAQQQMHAGRSAPPLRQRAHAASPAYPMRRRDAEGSDRSRSFRRRRGASIRVSLSFIPSLPSG